MNEYLSMTELGKLYGVTSHQIGRWLKALNLRTEKGRPTSTAFRNGYVTQRASRGIGTYYYVWNAEETMKLFAAMGYEPLEDQNDE